MYRAILAVSAVILTTVPAAQAGTMRQWVCVTDGQVPTNNTQGWVGSNRNVPGGFVSADCSGVNTSRILGDMSAVATGIGAGSGLQWTYTAPPSTSISTAHLYMGGAVYNDDHGASMGLVIYRGGELYDGDHVLDQCQRFTGCSFLQMDAQLSNTKVPYTVNAPVFVASIGCGSGVGAGCAGGFRGEIRVNGGYFNLVDDHAPTTGAPTGTATQAGALNGAETLVFSAADQGVGVSDVEVKIGNAVVLPRQRLDHNGGKCNPVESGYLWPVPCKTSVGATLNLDTTRAADGASQLLTATIWDAAGNATTAESRRVTIDNKLPPRIASGAASLPQISGEPKVGGTLTASNGTWVNATSYARQWQMSDDGLSSWKLIAGETATTLKPTAALQGKFVRVAVTASSVEGSTTASSAVRQIELIPVTPTTPVALTTPSGGTGGTNPANPTLAELIADNGTSGNPATGRLVPSRTKSSKTVNYGKTVRVEGTVVDAAGKPVVGAQIDVFELVKVNGAQRRAVGSVTSDANGAYVFKPKAQSSRTVELSYSRQRGAAVYQSTHTLQLTVRAGVSLRAEDASVRSFGTVVLRGRVLVSDLPKQGTLVQVRAGGKSGRWLTVGTPRTDSSGKFSWRWKFTNIRRGSVPFQVRLLRTGDLPAATNTSRTVRVRIG